MYVALRQLKCLASHADYLLSVLQRFWSQLHHWERGREGEEEREKGREKKEIHVMIIDFLL